MQRFFRRQGWQLTGAGRFARISRRPLLWVLRVEDTGCAWDLAQDRAFGGYRFFEPVRSVPSALRSGSWDATASLEVLPPGEIDPDPSTHAEGGRLESAFAQAPRVAPTSPGATKSGI